MENGQGIGGAFVTAKALPAVIARVPNRELVDAAVPRVLPRRFMFSNTHLMGIVTFEVLVRLNV